MIKSYNYISGNIKLIGFTGEVYPKYSRYIFNEIFSRSWAYLKLDLHYPLSEYRTDSVFIMLDEHFISIKYSINHWEYLAIPYMLYFLDGLQEQCIEIDI